MVYTDIYGPFPTASWNGHRYFITFTDDYSHYGYLYLIHEKSQSLELKLKISRIERLKPLDLTVAVSSMADTTAQVDVQDFLSIF